jgi:hypothetical protein
MFKLATVKETETLDSPSEVYSGILEMEVMREVPDGPAGLGWALSTILLN